MTSPNDALETLANQTDLGTLSAAARGRIATAAAGRARQRQRQRRKTIGAALTLLIGLAASMPFWSRPTSSPTPPVAWQEFVSHVETIANNQTLHKTTVIALNKEAGQEIMICATYSTPTPPFQK